MRYEIFVINIIIEPKNVWENPITYSDINRWYSNKVRCKKCTLTTYKHKPIDTQPETTSMPSRWQPTTPNHETHCRDRTEGRLELQLEYWHTRIVRVMVYVNGRRVWREESGLGREEEEEEEE